MRNIELINDNNLKCRFAIFKNANLKLASGEILKNFKLAFNTYGLLNENTRGDISGKKEPCSGQANSSEYAIISPFLI